MSGNSAEQTEPAQNQQRIATLETELTQVRSQLETLQQDYNCLRQSEARYRQIFENAPISILAISTDGHPVEMNSAAEKFIGWTIAEARETGFNSFMDANLIKNGTAVSAKRAIAGETVIEPPMYYNPSDQAIGNGQWRWAQGHYYPIQNEVGEVQEVVEIALDLTEMYEVQQALSQKHTNLLTTIAQVANLLLRSPDYTTVLPDVVRLLGEAVGSDRCIITYNLKDAGQVAVTFLESWFRTEDLVTGMIGSDPQSALPITDEWQAFYQQFVEGKTANFIVANLPEPMCSFFFEVHAATSMLLVPILVQGQLWGQIGFDNCGEPRLYDEAEIAIVKIAADSIAAAIERQMREDNLRNVLREMESRDRLLEATATAANVLLTVENLDEAVNAALQILGESLDTDRLNIHENFVSSPNASFPCYRTLYEWDSAQTLSQLSHPIAGEGSYAEIEWLYELFQQGQSASYQIKDAPEPFRSEQLAIGVQSTHLVPIYVEGNWWGVLGLDDCREAKPRSPAELAVLKTAAACVGSAIQRDRTQQLMLQAEQERSQELAKANGALKRTLDSLASEPSLEKFLGQVLSAIAEQFNSPMAEYWYHPEGNTAFIGMMSWQGQIYDREQISQQYPTHPGVDGFLVPPEMIHGEDLHHRKQHFVIEDWFDNPFTQELEWMPEQGLYKEINVPMVLGNDCLGALIVRISREQNITTQQIELAQALAHQVTLAVQLTRLAEAAAQEAQQAAIVEERNRIACDIHDTLAQTFTSMSIHLENLQYVAETDPMLAQGLINQLKVLSHTGLAEARRSVWALHPEAAKYEDLGQALQMAIDDLMSTSSLQTVFRLHGTARPVPPDVGFNFLRIAQEAITNTLRHAQAQTLILELAFEADALQLCIQDDGIGFDPALQNMGGFGLLGMRQRCDRLGAQLTLVSQPGCGTAIGVQIPMIS